MTNNKTTKKIKTAKKDQANNKEQAETSAGSEFLSLLRISELTQNF